MPDERWSAEQVAALAPDAASLKAARGSRWQAPPGWAGDVLWGLCQGSGKNPYQVCVDLSRPAYKCSCPSRKFPCKHALGLLLQWADGVPMGGEMPGFAAEWIASRFDRAERTAAQQDPVAAAKRAAQRGARVAAGMAELERWLDDQVQQGLAAAEPQAYETMAARLVDAQAPGVAATVRRLGGFAGAQWADRLLGELGLLRLLVAGYARLESLPAGLAATVRARIGFPVGSEEVLAGPALRDSWQVLGSVDTEDGNLATRRSWLLGADSGRFALVLSFAAPGQTLAADLVPGTSLDASLCFYPGAAPLRALISVRHGSPLPLRDPVGARPMRAALGSWAGDPWRSETPVLISGAIPTRDGWLTSADGALPLAAGHHEPWWLLAAGGVPAVVAGEWSAGGLRPLAAWVDGHYLPAAAPLPGGSGRRRPELPGDLLAAALVGTARKPWTGTTVQVGGRTLSGPGAGVPPTDKRALNRPGAGGPSADERTLTGPGAHEPSVDGRALSGPSSLLEAAGVAVTYRRAGVCPAPGHAPVAAAPEEIEAPLPAAAGARLLRILGEGGVPGGAQAAQDLLAQWLAAAAAHGGLVPPEALPQLLDAGRRNAAIRADLGRIAGRRGSWLAEMRPDWDWLLDEAPGAAVWELGSGGERLAYLTRLRAADPAAARELVLSAWPTSPAEDRARFLGALRDQLSTADDELLEGALDDRRKEVREVAVELARSLPESGYSRRMTARATAAVRLQQDSLGRERLVVEPPQAVDPGLRRDGVGVQPARGTGVGAWLLEEVVAGTPLSVWTSAFGREPADVVDLARKHDWEVPLLHGWAKAAVVQGATAWAVALLREDFAGLREAVRWDLHLILPPAELGRLAAEALRRSDHVAHRLLAVHPGRWPDELAVAVVETIAHRARTDKHSWQLGELCRAAAMAMPTGYASAVSRLAAELDHTADQSRARPVAELARTLTFRHEMLQEFQ